LVIHPEEAELVDDISGVYVDGDDGDDLVSEIGAEWSPDPLNQMTNSHNDLVEGLLHCSLTSSLVLVEGPTSLLSPHDTGGQKSDLRAVVLQPYVSLLVNLPSVGCVLSEVKNISESDLHFGLKVVQVVLDCAYSLEGGLKWDVFALVREHCLCSL